MDYNMEYNKHYIQVDARGCVVDGFSDAFRAPGPGDICINERGGYQFRLFPGGRENTALFGTQHRISLYKYEDGAVKMRSAEEIDADIAALPKPEPTAQDRLEAQVAYTAMMTDTLLEEV
jgi:hypothetical protein